jgi:NADH-quinone oxidoreductase subunit C
MAGDQFIADLKQRFGSKVIAANLQALDPWVEVTAEGILEVCSYLRDADGLQFDMLNCISAVDYLHTDAKKAAKAEWEPHIELVYHLSSIQQKHTLVLKVKLPRWKNDQEGTLPEVESVSGIWATADWHEREVYDLSGVRFLHHPNLRRILCPEDWVGYPLRKDYEMPLEYHGIRGR